MKLAMIGIKVPRGFYYLSESLALIWFTSNRRRSQ